MASRKKQQHGGKEIDSDDFYERSRWYSPHQKKKEMQEGSRLKGKKEQISTLVREFLECQKKLS